MASAAPVPVPPGAAAISRSTRHQHQHHHNYHNHNHHHNHIHRIHSPHRYKEQEEQEHNHRKLYHPSAADPRQPPLGQPSPSSPSPAHLLHSAPTDFSSPSPPPSPSPYEYSHQYSQHNTGNSNSSRSLQSHATPFGPNSNPNHHIASSSSSSANCSDRGTSFPVRASSSSTAAAASYSSSSFNSFPSPNRSQFQSPPATPRRINPQAQDQLDRLAHEASLFAAEGQTSGSSAAEPSFLSNRVRDWDYTGRGSSSNYNNSNYIGGPPSPLSPTTTTATATTSASTSSTFTLTHTSTSTSPRGVASLPDRTAQLNGPTRLQPLSQDPDDDEDDSVDRSAGRTLHDSPTSIRSDGIAPSSPLMSPSSSSSSDAAAARQVPRSASIDSAVSQSSARTHATGLTHSSSTASTSSSHIRSLASSQAAGTSPQDVASLIQAAGSPENLIQYLLKDKASLSNQNTQLWRLVDKQRAMILGLNKDLERALKEKEKYKKKLKEQLNIVPPAAPQPTPAGFPTSISPEPSDTASVVSPQDGPDLSGEPPSVRSQSLPTLHTPPLTLAPYPITPPAPHSPRPINAPSHQMPSPTAHAAPAPPTENGGAESNFPEPPSSKMGSQQQQDETPRASQHNLSTLHDDQQQPIRIDTRPAPAPAPAAPQETTPISPKSVPNKLSALPSLSVTNLPPGTNRPTPVRKAPPQPLDLVRSNMRDRRRDEIEREAAAAASVRRDDDDDDRSDAESVEELIYDRKPSDADADPNMPRKQHARRRSLDSPDGSDGSLLHTPEDKKGAAPSVPATAGLDKRSDWGSPRGRAGDEGGAASAGYMRTPKSAPIIDRDEFYNSRVPANLAKRLISPPPPSPGLPASPRPQDRPMQSPRLSGQLSPKYVNLPHSPKPGLPASPRIGVAPPPDSPRFNPAAIGKPAGSNLASPPLTQASFGNTLTVPTAAHSGPVISAPLAFSRTPLTASTLGDVEAKVVSSRLRPSRNSMLPGSKPSSGLGGLGGGGGGGGSTSAGSNAVFTLGVVATATGKELWRIEKDFSALQMLDARLRTSPSAGVDLNKTAVLPDRALFSGHSPARIDARRVALEEYFSAVMDSYLDEYATMALCDFLNTDVVDGDAGTVIKDGSESPDGKPLKEGYLTKRGKNFGGWKARYFVLDGPVFRYYEAPGGAHLGSIKLQLAQIGIQSSSAVQNMDPEGDAENQYRHAFLILEPKRKDSSSLVRHVLCAESDQERDEWVEALMKYVEKNGEAEGIKVTERHLAPNGPSKKRDEGRKKKDKKAAAADADGSLAKEENLRGFSYEEARPGEAPVAGRGPTPDMGRGRADSPVNSVHTNNSSSTLTDRGQKQISGPSNASLITDVAAWGNKVLSKDRDKDKDTGSASSSTPKKKGIWGFRPRTSLELEEAANGNGAGGQAPAGQASMGAAVAGKPLPPNRSIFGAPLEDAIALSKPAETPLAIPAVVYRCIAYLDARRAVNEEGIFRLSGSNVLIRQLRERFNTTSDVDLLAPGEAYHDVHAIAGLLKLYLRELPASILTTERRDEFVRASDVEDRARRLGALRALVGQLPRANYTLLRVLAGHLLEVVGNAEVNKMNVRNVGIVFSPTLNIPASLFSLFLTEFEAVFGGGEEEEGGRKGSVGSSVEGGGEGGGRTESRAGEARGGGGGLRNEYIPAQAQGQGQVPQQMQMQMQGAPQGVQVPPPSQQPQQPQYQEYQPQALPPPQQQQLQQLQLQQQQQQQQQPPRPEGYETPDYRAALALQSHPLTHHQITTIQQNPHTAFQAHLRASHMPPPPLHPQPQQTQQTQQQAGGMGQIGALGAPPAIQTQTGGKKKRESSMLGLMGMMGRREKKNAGPFGVSQGTRGMVEEGGIYE